MLNETQEKKIIFVIIVLGSVIAGLIAFFLNTSWFAIGMAWGKEGIPLTVLSNLMSGIIVAILVSSRLKLSNIKEPFATILLHGTFNGMVLSFLITLIDLFLIFLFLSIIYHASCQIVLTIGVILFISNLLCGACFGILARWALAKRWM